MNIPKIVKVGGYIYEVVDKGGVFVSGQNVVDGMHSFAELKIALASTKDTPYNYTVFLHEICHAIIAVYCADEQDEKYVEQFSKGLYQVIVENPDVFARKPYIEEINRDGKENEHS